MSHDRLDAPVWALDALSIPRGANPWAAFAGRSIGGFA